MILFVRVPHFVRAETNGKIELSPDERAWIAKNHTVHVRVVDFPPFLIVKKDNLPNGVCIDYIDRIAQHTGIHFKYDVTTQPFAEALQGLKQHIGPDLITTMMSTPDRKKSIAFTKEYIRIPRVIFTAENGHFITGIEDLSNKIASLQRGSVVHQEMMKHHPEINLCLFDTDAQALKAVGVGKADAYIGNLTVGSYLVLQHGFSNIRVAAPSKLADHAFSMGVRSDWPELSRILDKGLNSISPEQRLNIRSKYLAVRYEHGIQTIDIIKWGGGAGGFLILILLMFYLSNRRLRKEISARMIAEENLKQSKEMTGALLNATTESVFLIKPDGTFITMNDVAAKRFHKTVEELIGKSVFDLFPPELTRSRRELIRQIVYSKKPMRLEDERAGFILDNSICPIISADGSVSSIAVFSRDVTGQKKAEALIRESERNMASVLNNTKDGIVRIDRNFRHIFANPALYAATGLSPEQYLGKTNQEIGMPDELCTFWHNIHEYVFSNKKTTTAEFDFITIKRGKKKFQAIVTPEFDEDGTVVSIVSIIRDITELRNAISEKNAVIEELEQALAEIKTLRGLIPICSNCKNIRDDKGFWQKAEKYIQDRSDATFSHSLCPVCAKKLYPNWILDQDKS